MLAPKCPNRLRSLTFEMRAEGKEYVVHDGDVMNFLFNV